MRRHSITGKRGWSTLEHSKFLMALQCEGKGHWKSISNYIDTKTAKQVQSHAQKYFLRQKQDSSTKKKTSIHDFNYEKLDGLFKLHYVMRLKLVDPSTYNLFLRYKKSRMQRLNSNDDGNDEFDTFMNDELANNLLLDNSSPATFLGTPYLPRNQQLDFGRMNTTGPKLEDPTGRQLLHSSSSGYYGSNSPYFTNTCYKNPDSNYPRPMNISSNCQNSNFNNQYQQYDSFFGTNGGNRGNFGHVNKPANNEPTNYYVQTNPSGDFRQLSREEVLRQHEIQIMNQNYVRNQIPVYHSQFVSLYFSNPNFVPPPPSGPPPSNDMNNFQYIQGNQKMQNVVKSERRILPQIHQLQFSYDNSVGNGKNTLPAMQSTWE